MLTKTFKHQNMQMLHYGTGRQEAGPSTRTGQTLNDWNRLAENPEKCTYFINGQKLSDLATGFSSEEKLKEFLIKHLFNKAENPGLLTEAAIKHFHQAGLPHATNYSVTQQNNTQHQPQDPETRINFTWNNAEPNPGLHITEENTYRNWVHLGTGEKHHCTPEEAYYAKTKTTYLLTPDAKIKLLDLEIDCQSQHLAAVFDKREAHEQPYRGFRSLVNILIGNGYSYMHMMHLKREMMDNRAPEARTLYSDDSEPKGPAAQ